MRKLVFYHGCDLFNDSSIIKEQVELFEKTGILDEVDELHMMLHYEKDNFKWLEARWSDKKNVWLHYFDKSFKEWYEATTIYFIQELCHSIEEEFYVLYTHSKGATRPDSEIDKNWRHYLQYWTQEKWKECIQHLDDGYEICGPSLILPNTHHYHPNQEPFYAGNTWWARSSYLKTCVRLPTPPERNFKSFFVSDVKDKHHRFDMESWSGSGMPKKAYNMTEGARYNCWIEPPETYRIIER